MLDPRERFKQLIEQGVPAQLAIIIAFGGDAPGVGPTDFEAAMLRNYGTRAFNAENVFPEQGVRLFGDLDNPPTLSQDDWVQGDLIETQSPVPLDDPLSITGSVYTNPMYAGGQSPGSLGTRPIRDVIQEAFERGLIGLTDYEHMLDQLKMEQNFESETAELGRYPYGGAEALWDEGSKFPTGGEDLRMVEANLFEGYDANTSVYFGNDKAYLDDVIDRIRLGSPADWRAYPKTEMNPKDVEAFVRNLLESQGEEGAREILNGIEKIDADEWINKIKGDDRNPLGADVLQAQNIPLRQTLIDEIGDVAEEVVASGITGEHALPPSGRAHWDSWFKRWLNADPDKAIWGGQAEWGGLGPDASIQMALDEVAGRYGLAPEEMVTLLRKGELVRDMVPQVQMRDPIGDVMSATGLTEKIAPTIQRLAPILNKIPKPLRALGEFVGNPMVQGVTGMTAYQLTPEYQEFANRPLREQAGREAIRTDPFGVLRMSVDKYRQEEIQESAELADRAMLGSAYRLTPPRQLPSANRPPIFYGGF